MEANHIVLWYEIEVARISTGQLLQPMVKGKAIKYNGCSTYCGAARVDEMMKGLEG